MGIYSPQMLNSFKDCPSKYFYRYVKNIPMPQLESSFVVGKNIHAIAAYYLKGEDISIFNLSEKEAAMWDRLKKSPYFNLKTEKVEHNISIKIDNDWIGGRLDALVKNTDDEYFILDYKTGSIPKNAKYDFQTMIYILAVKEFFKTEKVNFIYIDLKNKDEVKVTYTPELGEEYKKALLATADKINNNDLPDKKLDCTCEYSSVCF